MPDDASLRTGAGGGEAPSPVTVRQPDDHGPGPDALSFRTCQWIAGEPGADDACKCGAPTADGRPYCAVHAGRAALHLPRRRVQAHFDRLAKEAWDLVPAFDPAGPSGAMQLGQGPGEGAAAALEAPERQRVDGDRLGR